MPRTPRHPDTHLLLRFRRGDDGAARALWDRYGPSLRAVARARLRGSPLDASDADDAVQAVFLAILKQPASRLKAIEDPAAYLARAARAAAIDLLRAHSRERTRVSPPVAASAPGSGAPVGPGRDRADDRADDLTAALDGLEPDARELLALVHVAGLTFDQVAIVTELPRSTAHDRYTAARRRLRERLGPETSRHRNPSSGPSESSASEPPIGSAP